MWPASQSGTPEHYQHHLSDSTKNDPAAVVVAAAVARAAVARAAVARAAVAAVGVVVAAVVFKHAKSAAAHLCDFVRATCTTRSSARRQNTKDAVFSGACMDLCSHVRIYKPSQKLLESLSDPYIIPLWQPSSWFPAFGGASMA